jgi:hypothetical protein
MVKRTARPDTARADLARPVGMGGGLDASRAGQL